MRQKRILSCFVLLILLAAAFTACRSEMEAYPLELCGISKAAVNHPADLRLTLKEGSAAPICAVFYLENTGESSYTYDNSYSLEVKLDGEWYTLDTGAFAMIGIPLAPGERVNLPTNWLTSCGKLPKGNYRFLKTVWKEPEDGSTDGPWVSCWLACEFKIP